MQMLSKHFSTSLCSWLLFLTRNRHDSSDDGLNTTTDCSKKSTNYNVPLRIGLIFVIMTTSFIGESHEHLGRLELMDYIRYIWSNIP